MTNNARLKRIEELKIQVSQLRERTGKLAAGQFDYSGYSLEQIKNLYENTAEDAFSLKLKGMTLDELKWLYSDFMTYPGGIDDIREYVLDWVAK